MIITWFKKNFLEKLKDFSRTKIIFVHTCYLLFIYYLLIIYYLLSQGFENPDLVVRDWLAIMMLFYHFSSGILSVELKTV